MGLTTEDSFDGPREKQLDAFVAIQRHIKMNQEMEKELAETGFVKAGFVEAQFTEAPETVASEEVEILKQQLAIARYETSDYSRLMRDDTELARFLQVTFGAELEWKQDRFRGDSTGAIAIYFLRRGTRPSMWWKLRRWLGW